MLHNLPVKRIYNVSMLMKLLIDFALIMFDILVQCTMYNALYLLASEVSIDIAVPTINLLDGVPVRHDDLIV